MSDSAAFASASACSRVTVMNAFRAGFSRSMRARHALVSSTGETLRVRSNSPTSDIESAARSSGARLCAETLTAAVAQAPTVVFRKSRLSQRNDARPPERLAAGRRVVRGHESQLSAFTHREHGKAGGRRLVADDENAAAGIE